MTTDVVETQALAIPAATTAITAAEFDAKVEEAHRKAQTLKKIVEQANLFKMIGDKKYLQVEAWQTIGQAYGYSARIAWCRPLDEGGFEARAEVVTPYGDVVGSAEAECGSHGDRPWDARPHYQQKSMAQTRAISKSLRSVLSWVVVLAGYEATPEDEMPKEEVGSVTTAAPAAAPTAPMEVCPVHGEPFFKTAKMRDWAHKDDKNEWCNYDALLFGQRLKVLAANAGIASADVATYIRESFAGKSYSKLTLPEMSAVCGWLLGLGAKPAADGDDEPF